MARCCEGSVRSLGKWRVEGAIRCELGAGVVCATSLSLEAFKYLLWHPNEAASSWGRDMGPAPPRLLWQPQSPVLRGLVKDARAKRASCLCTFLFRAQSKAARVAKAGEQEPPALVYFLFLVRPWKIPFRKKKKGGLREVGECEAVAFDVYSTSSPSSCRAFCTEWHQENMGRKQVTHAQGARKRFELVRWVTPEQKSREA